MRLAVKGLAPWFQKRTTIVAPARLPAAIAAKEFADSQLAAGSETWESLPIYSLGAWLTACWQEARDRDSRIPILLSPAQELLLWREIVEAEHPGLFDPAATARLASAASRVIAEWDIPTDASPWNDHQDANEFRRWLQMVQRRCAQENWMIRSDLWRVLPAWARQGLCAREPVVFAGFRDISPALRRVIASLGKHASVDPVLASKRRKPAPVKRFDDHVAELQHAARWARGQFERDASSSSIAVFVPNLAEHRQLVERTFRSVFYPASSGYRRALESESVYHLTARSPFSEQPLIASALLLLELALPRLPLATASAILRCPYIAGSAAEKSARALADLELRKRRDLDVGLRDLEYAAKSCAVLTRRLTAVREVLAERPRAKELALWADFMGDLLRALHWPGDGDLWPHEQDLVRTWNDTLSDLGSLGMVSASVPYRVALAHLRSLLDMQSVATGDLSSPVQVLDSSESAAIHFDCALVTGLSDETWPRPVPLSPLIPFALQRACGVPGSTPETLERERGRATESLFQAANELAASYTGQLSPIAEPFVRHERVHARLWSGKLPVDTFAPAVLQELEDSDAPPFQPTDSTRGGTSLIKAQSQCPFRAFAEYRLLARAPEDATFGFDSRDRGGFVHKALESVWNAFETQQRLRAASVEERRTVVRNAVNEAVKDNGNGPFHQLATVTERDRLETLLMDWLEIEAARKQPFTVQTLEQERFFDLNGLRLRLRVDRIDLLANGKVLLIDYKSGKQTRNKLKCPRPPEPQLLVYAASVGDEVDGLFFAELRPREAGVVGISREKHFESRSVDVKKTDWPVFLREARAEVGRLASDFLQGRADVAPLKNACDFCAVKPLCRVNEDLSRLEDPD